MWFVGDLVNRGPSSLEVLRFVRELGASAVTVLGNHDLHLIERRRGTREPRRRDTFDDVLDAPDGDVLIDWLVERPLLHREGDAVMVHAGILPEWSIQQVEAIAQEIEEDLRAGDPASFFEAMYGNEPSLWDDVSTRAERMRIGINAMTRMRALTRDEGRIDLPVGRHARDRKRMSVRARVTREAHTAWRVSRRFPASGCACFSPPTILRGVWHSAQWPSTSTR